MCCVWNCRITSNWIFMGATWTTGLPMLHSFLTWIMLHECFIPGSHILCNSSGTSQCSSSQPVMSGSITLYISESDKPSKNKYWSSFHKLAVMCKWTIYIARKEEWDIKEVMWSKVNEIIISAGVRHQYLWLCSNLSVHTDRHRHMCSFWGCGKISLSQPPGSKLFRGYQKLQDSAWHCQYMME